MIMRTACRGICRLAGRDGRNGLPEDFHEPGGFERADAGESEEFGS